MTFKARSLTSKRDGIRRILICAALVIAESSVLCQATPAQNPQQGPPPSQDTWAARQKSSAWITEKLAKSGRHSEWVRIPSGNRTINAWVDYPNVKGKVPVVFVLHEVFGLTESTRNTADEIAAMGYIAITPDMLSDRGPNGGDVDSFANSKITSQTLTSIPDDEVNSDLDALADYGLKLPEANGKFAVVGLSWGGGAAFRYSASTQRKELRAVCIFYDIGPPAETQSFPGAPTSISVDKISVPVYGFYGSTDKRPLVTLDATKAAMAAAGKVYEPVVYDGADHAYMRVGVEPNAKPANVAAVQESRVRLEKLLKGM